MMISHVSKKGFAWLIDSCLVTTLASPPKDPHDDDDEDEADNEDNEEENEESRRSSENQTNVDSQRVASVLCYHGVLLGGLYTLFATGPSISAGVLRFVNIARGARIEPERARTRSAR